MYLGIVFVFLLGMCVGSFLNVVTMRLGKLSVVRGRSHCPSCKHALSPLELVPVVSYLFLKGRCRSCRAPISLQYPIVELFTGASFAYLLTTLMGDPVSVVVLFLYGAIILSLCIAIAVYDYWHTIVPDVLVYPLALLSLLGIFFSPTLSVSMPSLIDLLSGPLVATPFAALWLVSKGRWIGLGDAKIALPIGWLLGTTAGFTAVAIAFWSGAVVSLLLLLVSRLRGGKSALTMKSEVPFAPFLLLGTAVVYATGMNFFFIL